MTPTTSAPAAATRSADTDAPQWAFDGRGTRRYRLSQLLDHAAAVYPDKAALSDGQRSFTFTQLRDEALSLAARLRAAGVRPGQAVVVLAEKSALVPVAALAIWRVGAIYVPLDPSWPVARFEAAFQVLPLAAVIALRADQPSLGLLPTSPRVPRITAGSGVPSGPVDCPCADDSDESQAAYVIFTSGSTGVPKGVQISRGSLLDYFANHNTVLRFDSASRVFSLAPFYFDVSIEDTLLPLSLGAFVYQYRGMALGEGMRGVLRRERITHLIAVSTLLGLITGDGSEVTSEQLPDLRMVMTGAEVCDPKVIDLWKTRLPGARVINAYGPTEATIVATCHEITKAGTSGGRAYPIGRPLPGVALRLVSQDGRVVPPQEADVAGELWIGGTQVMSGYIGQPLATQRVLREVDGVRWYLSGDICRFNRAGEVEFIGRRDDEVKLGGRRIHLGELRQTAIAIPGVQRVAVGLRREGALASIELVAVIDDGGPDETQIRQALASRLPAYMLPARLTTVDAAQLGSTGKTDEKALLQRLRLPLLSQLTS